MKQYTMRFRPPGFGTLPSGWKFKMLERPALGNGYDLRNDLPRSDHRFGVFQGEERDLTPEEVDSFEVVEAPPSNYAVIEAMAAQGGSFVQALAEAFRRADLQNFAVLKSAFPDYWKQYTQAAQYIAARKAGA